jgi:hypothetical protein
MGLVLTLNWRDHAIHEVPFDAQLAPVVVLEHAGSHGSGTVPLGHHLLNYCVFHV